MNAQSITLFREQQIAYDLLINYMSNPISKEFILLGSAGCGKTALIGKFICDIAKTNKKIVIAAPTHQALGVIKSTFLGRGDVKYNTVSIQTIQSLLGYVQYYNKAGEKYFAKGKYQKNWKDYELIIVDECSMLTNQIIDDIREKCKQNVNIKIIYVGDPAQLPPINQPTSKLFTGNVTAEKYELTEIIRTNNNEIINLSRCHRDWVFSGDIRTNVPKLKDYVSANITLFNYRTDTNLWLDTFIEKIKNETQTSIILSWTNASVDSHNDYVRNKIFNKTDLKKYEDGEIVIFTDFYKLKVKIDDNPISYVAFRASEQVKIVDSQFISKKLPMFKQLTEVSLKTNELNILAELQKLINTLNTNLNVEYKFYILNVTKINKGLDDNIYPITVFKEKIDYKLIINSFEESMRETNDVIYEHIKNLKCENDERTKLIDFADKRMTKIRMYFNEKIIGHIASIGYGYAITVHKAQGTTVNNAFINVIDICQNHNKEEMIKCLYTSFTRPSGEIFILG